MSVFQPNKFQPIWRYIQKDITILSLVVGSSRKSEILFIFLIFVPLLVSFVRQHGQHTCSTLHLQQLLHMKGGQQQRQHTSSHLSFSSQSASMVSPPPRTAPAAPGQHGQHGQHLPPACSSSCSTCKGQNLCWSVAWAAPFHLTSTIST
jgi:hypothetical protein